MIKNIKTTKRNNIIFFIILLLLIFAVVNVGISFICKTNNITINKQVYSYLAKNDFDVKITPVSEEKPVKGQCVYEISAEYAQKELKLNDKEVKVYLPDSFKKNSTEFTVYSVGYYENHLQVLHRDIKVNSEGDLIFKKSSSAYLKKYVISRKEVAEDNNNNGNNDNNQGNNNNQGTNSGNSNNNGDNNSGSDGTQEEKLPDGTIPGGDIAELDRLDFINAKKSAYEKYIEKGEEYAEQIAQKKSFLSMSYDLLKRMLSGIGENPDNLPFVYGQTLGLNTKHQISQGGSSSTLASFLWPIPSLAGQTWDQVITSPFGWRDCPFHGREMHDGIDIGAGEGTPIVAISAGTVINAGWNEGGYGNWVVIQHANGYTSLYGHMYTTPSVTVGQQVTAGQEIGGVGTTGSSTGNHLHMTIEKDGVAVDPKEFYNDDLTSKASFTGEGEFDITTTHLSKEDFITKTDAYLNDNSGYNAYIKPRLDYIFDYCKQVNINPELVIITAIWENGDLDGYGCNNFWNVGVPNDASPSAGCHSSFEGALQSYCQLLIDYNTPGTFGYNMIIERATERAAAGANPMGYGTPATLNGQQSVYSWLGDSHIDGGWGGGGYPYLKVMYGDEFEAKCGSVHAFGSPTTVIEQADYTVWQVAKKVKTRQEMYGY